MFINTFIINRKTWSLSDLDNLLSYSKILKNAMDSRARLEIAIDNKYIEVKYNDAFVFQMLNDYILRKEYKPVKNW